MPAPATSSDSFASRPQDLPIPPTSRYLLLQAMRWFDRDRALGGVDRYWRRWPESAGHTCAIAHDGRLYPIRETIRRAVWLQTGGAYRDWRGPEAGHAYVRGYGFDVVPLPTSGAARAQVQPGAWSAPVDSARNAPGPAMRADSVNHLPRGTRA